MFVLDSLYKNKVGEGELVYVFFSIECRRTPPHKAKEPMVLDEAHRKASQPENNDDVEKGEILAVWTGLRSR